eukprot:6130673-Amphidinium_carterae.2
MSLWVKLSRIVYEGKPEAIRSWNVLPRARELQISKMYHLLLSILNWLAFPQSWANILHVILDGETRGCCPHMPPCQQDTKAVGVRGAHLN